MQPVITFSNSLFCNGLIQRLDNSQISSRTVSTDQTDESVINSNNSNGKATGQRHDSKVAAKSKTLPRKYRVSCQRFYADDFRRRDLGSISQRRKELIVRQSDEMLNELESLRVSCESLVQQHPNAKLVELEDLNSEARAIVEICKQLKQQDGERNVSDLKQSSAEYPWQTKFSVDSQDRVKQYKQKRQHIWKKQCKASAKSKSIQIKNVAASGDQQLEQRVKEVAQYEDSDHSTKQQAQTNKQIDTDIRDIFNHLQKVRIEKEHFIKQCEVLSRLQELKQQCRKLAYMVRIKPKVATSSTDPEMLRHQCREMSRKANSGKDGEDGDDDKCQELALKKKCAELAKGKGKEKCEEEDEDKSKEAKKEKGKKNGDKSKKAEKEKGKKEDAKGKDKKENGKEEKSEEEKCKEREKEEEKALKEQCKKMAKEKHDKMCKEYEIREECAKLFAEEKARKKKEANQKKSKEFEQRLECENEARKEREKQRKEEERKCEELAHKRECARLAAEQKKKEEMEELERKCKERQEKKECGKSDKKPKDEKDVKGKDATKGKDAKKVKDNKEKDTKKR